MGIELNDMNVPLMMEARKQQQWNKWEHVWLSTLTIKAHNFEMGKILFLLLNRKWGDNH